MIYWSVGVAIAGVLGSWATLLYFHGRDNSPVMEHAWLVGLAALVPASLMVVLSLLGKTPADVVNTPLPRSVLVTSAAALLAVIFTDTLNRRLLTRFPKLGPFTSWFLGVVSLIPAWIIALWALGSS